MSRTCSKELSPTYRKTRDNNLPQDSCQEPTPRNCQEPTARLVSRTYRYRKTRVKNLPLDSCQEPTARLVSRTYRKTRVKNLLQDAHAQPKRATTNHGKLQSRSCRGARSPAWLARLGTHTHTYALKNYRHARIPCQLMLARCRSETRLKNLPPCPHFLSTAARKMSIRDSCQAPTRHDCIPCQLLPRCR